MKFSINCLAVMVFALLVSACGGGGGGSPSSGGGITPVTSSSVSSIVSPSSSSSSSVAPLDTDGDGIADIDDSDDDGDGTTDTNDVFPLDKKDWADFDGDGMGDSVDTDDDNDGLLDVSDSLKAIIKDLATSPSALSNVIADPSRKYFYLSYREGKILSVVDATTGKVVKTFTFDYMPEAMYLAKDASKLYVSLITKEHDDYWSDNQVGYVVTIDLNTLTQTSSLTLAIDPYDIAVTSKGKLIVSGGSGQFTNINLYDLVSGNLVTSAWQVRQMSKITLTSNESTFYAANIYSGWLTQFNLGDATISTANDTYNGSVGGQLWISPDNKYFFTRSGSVLAVSDLSSVSQLIGSNLTVQNVTFDDASQTALLSVSDGKIILINLSSFETVTRFTLFGQVKNSAIMGGNLYSVVSQNSVTSIIKQENPCPRCATNNIPKAAFTITSTKPDTTGTWTFDAATSTDADADGLSYRWDINGDGVWDTSYSSNPKFDNRFIISGLKYIRLQVKDALGATSTATQSIDVKQGIDTGTAALGSIPNMLNFSITDSLTNKAGTTLYAIDKATKRLYLVDIATGITQRYFTFDAIPDHLAISADGSRVFVSLLTKEANQYNYSDTRQSYIAVIDTVQPAYINTLSFSSSIYDIFASSKDKVVAFNDAGFSTQLSLYDSATGSTLGSAYLSYNRPVVFNNAGNILYVFDYSSLRIFDVSGSVLTELPTKFFASGYYGVNQIWMTPNDQYLISDAGYLINLSTMSATSLTTSGVTITSVSFDVANQIGFLVQSNGFINVINLKSFESIKLINTLGSVDNLVASGEAVYMTSNLAGLLSVIKIDHPCATCASNQSPVADFAIVPASGDTSTTFSFDASASSDPESSSLSYRWDLNGDGNWDAGFSSNKTANYRFTLPGNKTIRLQVKDALGAVTTQNKTLTVAQGVYTGTTVTSSTANNFNFIPADSATDTLRGKLYLSDKNNKRVYIVDIATGLTEKYFEFEFMPERMTLSPNSEMLYVALPAAPHDYYSDASGYVAVIDLSQQAVINAFALANDPYDLAVTSGGVLVTTSNSSGAHKAYGAANGGYLFDISSVYQNSMIVAHPSNEVVYILDYQIKKISIASNLPVQSAQTSSGRLGRNLWITPDGSYLISGGGDIYSASDLSLVSSLTAQGIAITGVSFDSNSHVAFVSANDGYLYSINSISWETLSKTPITGSGVGTSVVGGKIYTLLAGGNSSSLLVQDHPCLPCATNHAPVASFSRTPATGDTSSTYTFNATASSDQDSDSLSYRWDLNGDGLWDTNYSSQATVSKRFSLAGNKTVKLQIKDAYGLTHSISQSFSVAQGIDTGTNVTGSAAFVLDFTASYLAVDKTNSKLYVSDRDAKRLYVLDIATGLTEKYFEFEFMPERMTIDPTGSFLYLALTTQDHRPYWLDEAKTGYIAVINLADKTFGKTFAVSLDPYDLAVAANNKLVVSSGSGQWPYIHAYDVVTGSYLGQADIFEVSELSVDPTGKSVFAAREGWYYINKFDVQGLGITALGNSPYHSDQRVGGNVWVTPNGLNLITAGGDVFLADMTFVKNMTPQYVGIKSLAFNSDDQTVIVLRGDNKTILYSLSDSSELATLDAAAVDPREIFVSDGVGYLLKFENGQYVIQKLQ